MHKPDIEQTSKSLSSKAFVVVLWISILAVLVQAWIVGAGLDGSLVELGSDSVMRLVSVRNWLGGQGWFDTMEYRLVPPEGTLLHWSRYIDAVIGGLILLFSNFVPVATAEVLAVSIWPTVLMVGFIMVTGFGTRRLFGPVAACFAVLCVLTWPFTSAFYFRAGQIDHHNVQVLTTALMTFAVIWPGKSVRSGLVAGVAAAVSLTVGLETLPYILALGFLLFLRAVFAMKPDANRLLVTFCLALGIGSVVLWLGQTPSDRLTYPVCDQLGLPVLSLIVVAGAASILPFVFGLRRGFVRFAVSLVIVGLGCTVAWPWLGECLAGPYGALPLDVQEIIRLSITEAQPALTFAQRNALLLIKMSVPIVVTILIAGVFWQRMANATAKDADRRDMVGQLLILCAVGLGAGFFQVRLFSMSAGAFPVLAGFVLASFLKGYFSARAPGDAVKFLGASVLIIAPAVLGGLAKPLLPTRTQATTTQDRNCRDGAALMALNAVAPSVLLTPMNLGPAVLLQTHHAVLAGPYHRSPEAFANGKIPFELPQQEMKTYLDDIGAQHLVLCNGTNYGPGFASDMAAGGVAAWLRPVALEAGDLMLFEILETGDS